MWVHCFPSVWIYTVCKSFWMQSFTFWFTDITWCLWYFGENLHSSLHFIWFRWERFPICVWILKIGLLISSIGLNVYILILHKSISQSTVCHVFLCIMFYIFFFIVLLICLYLSASHPFIIYSSFIYQFSRKVF